MDTMESGDVKINFITKTFSTVTSSSPLNLNNLCINFSKRFKKSPIGKSDRSVVPWTGFDPASPLPVSQICLKLSYNEFTPIHLFPLIDSPLHNRPLSKYIAEAIAARAYLSVGLLHSMLMSVEVVITQKLFSVTPVSCLAEEETREEENKTTCPICLENLLIDDDNIDDKVRKLPHCLHRFHEKCISEWLIRCKSCPLCRKIVLQESQ